MKGLPPLRAWDGPLTRELDTARGAFGLGQVPARLAPDALGRMVCGYCSTGCALDVHLKDGAPVSLSPATNYPVNLGMACPKGWEALAPLAAADRATRPLLRSPGGTLAPVDWHEAMTVFTTRFRAIAERHGPAANAFLGTGQLPSEELALLGLVAKLGMGMVHGDGNTRQCMASAVVAYKEAFGFDAPPYTYADFEASDVLVFWGANPCVAHPIMWERVCRNQRQPAIAVVDPRLTETAMAATLHLPLQPKTDLALLYGVARRLIERGWIDEPFIGAHTTGFDDFAAFVEPFTLARVVAETGLAPAAVESLADLIGTGGRVSMWWTMGVNQSHQGVRTAQAIIDLALMTGNIGKPGTGANSITGQCNAMGSRLFSNTSSLFCGRDAASAADRAEVAAILGVDAARIPDQPSLAYDQILEQVLDGRIKGLWIVGTNPAHSWINQRDLHDVLGRLDFLVVQDMYTTTETAERADLLLPAAGWGEKDGTFINSERRVGRIRRVAVSPGEALSDYSIIRLVAEYWGCADLVARWQSPAEAFDRLRELSRGRPCDITGLDWELLDRRGGVQWPAPEHEVPESNERRLFEDGRFFHPDGRARFLFEPPIAAPERPNARYPFTLLTGRGSSAQWHTQTRTAKSAVLATLAPREPYVEINPADARRLGIHAHQRVRVASPRGHVDVRAMVTATIAPGQLFAPMHDPATNQLTFPAFDPRSRQPSYKACAASVRPLRRWETR
jgi:assimilatory nitrate reductase catalytic subunit